MATDDLFPHKKYPYRLDLIKEQPKRICWFESQEHLEKYIERSKLKKNEYKVSTKEGVEIVVQSSRRKSRKK